MGAEYHPATAAVADWSAPLAALSPAECPPVLEPDGGVAGGAGEVLLVAVCPEALKGTVEWLAAAPQVGEQGRGQGQETGVRVPVRREVETEARG